MPGAPRGAGALTPYASGQPPMDACDADVRACHAAITTSMASAPPNPASAVFTALLLGRGACLLVVQGRCQERDRGELHGKPRDRRERRCLRRRSTVPQALEAGGMLKPQ